MLFLLSTGNTPVRSVRYAILGSLLPKGRSSVSLVRFLINLPSKQPCGSVNFVQHLLIGLCGSG
jgi:hypothetical protein